MKKFNVKVNDKSYRVEVEEIGEVRVARPAPAVKPPLPAVPPSRPVEVRPAGESKEGKTVNSPMPGTIAAVEVKEGDTVKQGQVLLILEAMKMENEIPAPSDGKIVSLKVTAGSSVSAGDVLVILE
jgi:biotin carboxyl carrier protein